MSRRLIERAVPVEVEAKAIAKAIVDRADDLGLLWHLRPATVAKPGADGTLRAVFDGDTVPIPMTSLVGPLVEGERVQVLITPPAGNHIVGFAGLPPGPLGVIAHVDRPNSSTANAGVQGVLRLDGVPVRRNRRYEIRTSSLLLFSSVAGDTATARISFTTDGSVATPTSAILDLWNSGPVSTTANGTGGHLSVDYLPTTDHKLSLLLFTNRVSGTGAVSLNGNPDRIQLVVEDKGAARKTQGVGTVL